MSLLSTSVDGGVATIRLERVEVRNALSDEMLGAIVRALAELEEAPDVGCAVIAGQEEFFSVGADLHELAAQSPVDVLRGPRARLWSAFRQTRTPTVAAVSGHCLGGGCELALSCDLIVSSPTASFGQPETGLGLIPGGGGSQLLVGLVGRAVAADMILSGRRLGAEEAMRLGLVARLAPADGWLAAAQDVAAEIAARPRLGTMLAKQAIAAAGEMPLTAGAHFERALYQLALAGDDARAGLAEFASRRTEVG